MARKTNKTGPEGPFASTPSGADPVTGAPAVTGGGTPIEDAVIVSGDDAISDRSDNVADDAGRPSRPDDLPDDVSTPPVDDAEPAVDTGPEPLPDDAIVAEVAPEAVAATPDTQPDAGPDRRADPAPPARDAERSGAGFVPLLLGGLLAGGIGYAAATFLPPPAVDTARVDALQAQLDAIAIPEPVDTAPLTAAQDDLEGALAALATRVSELEGAAPEPGPAAQAAGASIADIAGADAVERLRADLEAALPRLDALRGDLDGLRDEADSLRGDVTATTGGLDDLREEVTAATGSLDDLRGDVTTATESLDDLRTQVAAMPALDPLDSRVTEIEGRLDTLSTRTESAEDEADRLARDAARNRLVLAVEAGLPYEEPLAVLGGTVPLSLFSAAGTGLDTTGELAADFPPLARLALSAARGVEPVEGNPLTAFLRRQTGARSLEPRDGADADAVLSRAEAAVRAGDVAAALAEIATLPEPAREALSGWTERAEARVAASAALQDYLKSE